MGRHEELTLYAAVALANDPELGESSLFALVQQVEGWGRIQIVERLAKTSNPAIAAWMLREGYSNSVMVEYTAYSCATAGRLRAALEQPSVDVALLAGAGDIIVALIAGGPAENIDDYADAAVVVERYLHHPGGQDEQSAAPEGTATVACASGWTAKGKLAPSITVADWVVLHSPVPWILAALGLVSFGCLLHLWSARPSDRLWRRLVWSVLVMIPLVGPLLYGSVYSPVRVNATPEEVQRGLDAGASVADAARH